MKFSPPVLLLNLSITSRWCYSLPDVLVVSTRGESENPYSPCSIREVV